MSVQSRIFNKAVVEALPDNPYSGSFVGALGGSMMGLFTSNGQPNNNTPLASLTEPLYNGYVRVSCTWSDVYMESDGSYSISTQLCQFSPTNDLVSSTITGWFIADVTGNYMLLSDLFDDPIALVNEDSSALVSVKFSIGGSNNGGATVIS